MYINKSLYLDRDYILGIAMYMVLIYHFFCWIYNPIGRLNIGYLGVDIFLFFSGYGLTYSFKKYTIITFYYRRIKRIIPLYSITSLLIIIITYPNKWNGLIDALEKMTTISYYINPAVSIDWYLNALFLFYLLYPVFYFLVKKVGVTIIISFIICYLLIYYTNKDYGYTGIHWKHDCFLARIPIFCCGILYALNQYSIKQKYIKALIPITLLIPLYNISIFLSISTLTLIFILLITHIHFPNIIKQHLNYIGRHTLEIYCSNIITHNIINEYLDYSIYTKALGYFLLQILISVILIKANISIHFSKSIQTLK